MKKRSIAIATIALGLLALSGCSSTKMDSDTSKAVSSFKSHTQMKEAFTALEKQIDSGKKVNRQAVHAKGFNPTKTAVSVINYIDIIDKFTANGNEVAADLGAKPPKAILNCILKGKVCTAYHVNVTNTASIEKPHGSYGALKSTLDLEEIRHITIWKFSVIIIFDGEQAVYAQVEESIEPNTTITIEKNSALKKIVRGISK